MEYLSCCHYVSSEKPVYSFLSPTSGEMQMFYINTWETNKTVNSRVDDANDFDSIELRVRLNEPCSGEFVCVVSAILNSAITFGTNGGFDKLD